MNAPVPSQTSTDLVVLGAGPAGLAAAWRAARRGLEVTVLERADRWGGMAGSFEVAGVRVDHGSHRLHPATPPHLLADLRDLLGADLQTRPRAGRLRVGGRWVGFPLRPAELARKLPPGLVAGVAWDAVTGPLRRPRSDTYAEVLRASLGPALYDALYAPYAVKLWGLDGDRIAGEQARRRVTADTPWKIAARMLRRRGRQGGAGPEGGSGRGQGRVFYYPRRGFGQLVDVLAGAAADAGATIRLGVAAERLTSTDQGVTIDIADGRRCTHDRCSRRSRCRCWAGSRTPARPQRWTLPDGWPSARWCLSTSCTKVGGTGPTTRTTFPARRHRSPGSRSRPTTGSRPRTRAIEPSSARSFRARSATRSGRRPTTTLAGLVEDALAASGLPPIVRAGVVVRRLPHVYPVYEVGYERHLVELDAWATALPSVTTFGRLGTFAHDNTHHAIAMAYDAVDALTTDGFDDAAWARGTGALRRPTSSRTETRGSGGCVRRAGRQPAQGVLSSRWTAGMTRRR